MPDDDTESYRMEQGRPPRPDPRDRQADVPLAFSSGGVLSSGADDRGDAADEGIGGSADGTAAVERGAAAIAAERQAAARDGGTGTPSAPEGPAQSPPSSRS